MAKLQTLQTHCAKVCNTAASNTRRYADGPGDSADVPDAQTLKLTFDVEGPVKALLPCRKAASIQRDKRVSSCMKQQQQLLPLLLTRMASDARKCAAGAAASAAAAVAAAAAATSSKSNECRVWHWPIASSSRFAGQPIGSADAGPLFVPTDKSTLTSSNTLQTSLFEAGFLHALRLRTSVSV